MGAPASRPNHTPVSNLLLAGVLVAVASGCSVQKQKNGETENVKLRTPIGSLDVRTNAVHGPDVGLPVYPGAVETGKHGNDSGSADIHMSFGNWRLNVKAIEYHSDDSEDKVVAFYKNAMSRYGDVLTCKNRVALGMPTKTQQGLTCANDHEYEVNVKVDTPKKPEAAQTSRISGYVKLLSGSPENQRIVEFSPTSKGTRFSIVVVQLPHKNQTD
jgi:hypothetical protein